jgi:hypothetical protein
MDQDEIMGALDRLGMTLEEAEDQALIYKTTVGEYLEKALTHHPSYIKAYSYPRHEIMWIISQNPRTGDMQSFRILVRKNTTPFYRRPSNEPVFHQIREVDNPNFKWMIGKTPTEIEDWISMTPRQAEIATLQKKLEKAITQRKTFDITDLELQIYRKKTEEGFDLDTPRGWLRDTKGVPAEFNLMDSNTVLRRKHYWDLADIARKPSNYVMPQTHRTIGIVGSRRRNSAKDYEQLMDQFLKIYKEGDTIVSGGASSGAD